MGAELKLGCVLVHHRNFPGVLPTIAALFDAGVSPDDLIVVDNSEDGDVDAALRAAVPAHSTVLATPNRGYGNAVNIGIRAWQSRGAMPTYLLVSTHETIASKSAVTALVAAMDANPNAAVCGPTLTDSHSAGGIWSIGGDFRRLSGAPYHLRDAALDPAATQQAVPRGWLDGAFCLYRSSTLQDQLLREDFVMYCEEVELHLRMRAAGGEALWVRDSQVGQRSSGTPAFFLTRNLQILLSAHGLPHQRLIGAPLVGARYFLRTCLRPGRTARLIDLTAGWWAGIWHRPVLAGEPWADGARLIERARRTPR